jgi:metal-responsive CopG/Arc/MetJ family transcriptional regulator
MLRQKRNDKPVLLNLPTCLLGQVDMAVREQGVTRSQFLRQAIERNLRHYQRVEHAIFARIYREGMIRCASQTIPSPPPCSSPRTRHVSS